LCDRIKKDVGVAVLKIKVDGWDKRITPIESVNGKVKKIMETIA
jgi:hypothetical protein